jgi:hypothetical protein
MGDQGHKNRVLLELGKQPDIVAWNAPVGTFYTREGYPVKVGIKGQADILGFILWRGLPIAFAVEAKFQSGRLSPEQKTWRDALLARGGLYAVARDPSTIVSELRAELAKRVQIFLETNG